MNDNPATSSAGETITEIAARYGRARSTVSTKWSLRHDWPAPIGTRGRAYLYDPEEVDAWFNWHPQEVATVDWIPVGLYSLREVAAASGVRLSTLRSRLYSGAWPAADDVSGMTHLWFGTTIVAALSHGLRPLHARKCT